MARKGGNCIIAYGNSRSNLCRIISNMSLCYGVPCIVVSSDDAAGRRIETNNSLLVNFFGAEIVHCTKNNVAETMCDVIQRFKKNGYISYYVNGNQYGKGNESVPVQAYVDVYNEIITQEKMKKIKLGY